MGDPTPKTLILDLLSTLKHGSMPVGALVEAGALFALEANAMRVAVARLLASGEITRDERGRYRLGERAVAVRPRAGSWRDVERRTRRWTGGWIAVHPVATGRAVQRPRAHALRLLGFGALLPTLWLRPDNLSASVESTRQTLVSLGLPREDLVVVVTDLDPAAAARARGLWDVRGLCAAHRGLRAELERSARQLPKLAAHDAMVESFLLGGRAIRQLVRDPVLPEAMCPAGDREALGVALRHYDRLGRAAWADFLRRFDVPSLRAPLDGRHAPPALELTG